MTTLRDVRSNIRDYMLQHEQQPMNEQQVRAVFQQLLIDLADVEAGESDGNETPEGDNPSD